MLDLKQVIRPNILGLEPYRCARDDFTEGLLLDANENTFGPALALPSEQEEMLALNRYPDPHQVALKQQIVDFRNAAPNAHRAAGTPALAPPNVCLGVGSDESIDLLMRCCCRPGADKVLVCPPTYGMYLICATVNDVAVAKVPLRFPGFDLDVGAVENALARDPLIKLVYLTSPGNPTGRLIPVEQILRLLRWADAHSWQGLVVVDEAYVDFVASASASVATLVNQYARLVCLQTLSKSFGLAGIRLGITFAAPELIRYLNAIKYPYNISSLAASVATRATSSGLAVMRLVVKEIVLQRLWVFEELQRLKRVGQNVGGLDANFLLLEILDAQGRPSNDAAMQLYTKLAVENQVVVRFRGRELNCEGCLRVTIGTREENEELVRVFKRVLEEMEAGERASNGSGERSEPQSV